MSKLIKLCKRTRRRNKTVRDHSKKKNKNNQIMRQMKCHRSFRRCNRSSRQDLLIETVLKTLDDDLIVGSKRKV